MGIFESEFVGNLAYIHFVFGNQFFSAVDYIKLDIFLSCLAEFLFDKVSEIIGGEAGFPGTHLDRGESLFPGIARLETVVDRFLEAAQDSAVMDFAGYELTVIKAGAIVQDRLNRGGDDLLGMFVYGVFKFGAYLPEAVQYNLLFALRRMQGFVGVV